MILFKYIFSFHAPSIIITMDDNSSTVVHMYNLPNMKQWQNGVEAALTIYRIVLDGKAYLPGPKEVTVSYC
jgi:hypothetical protein